MRRPAALASIVALFAGDAAAETVRLRADPWCPYNCEAWSTRPGFAVEMARAALADIGVTIDYATMPWARAVAEARAGRIEGVIGADPDGDGDGFVFPNESIGLSVNVLVMRADSPFKFTRIADLEGLSIGAVIGYSYSPALDAYLAANRARPGRVQLVGGDAPLETNLRKLASGRVSAVLENAYVARYGLRLMTIDLAARIVDLGEVGRPVKIGFSPARPEATRWARAFDDGVARLRASGALAEILERYGVEDWSPSVPPRPTN